MGTDKPGKRKTRENRSCETPDGISVRLPFVAEHVETSEGAASVVRTDCRVVELTAGDVVALVVLGRLASDDPIV